MDLPIALNGALLSAPLDRAAAVAFGLVVGSFLNVVIARVPRGQSVIRPGSRCPGCAAEIRALDNIPVLSYLWLRGRCRGCRAPISPRYPLVEIMTALLFLAATLRFNLTPVTVFRDWPFLSLLVAITFIDLDHRIIPDPLSLGGLAWGLLTSWMDPQLGVLHALIGAGVGFGIFYLLAWTYLRLAGRSGLGGGDIKLLAMLGAFLGVSGVLTTLLISSITGSVAGLAYAYWVRKRGDSDQAVGTPISQVAIPFGPFLVIGGIYQYLFSDLLWLPFTIPT